MARTLTILVFALGCVQSSPPALTPVTEDAGADSQVDVGESEAESESEGEHKDGGSHDAVADASPDVLPDAQPDAGTDAIPDMEPDAGIVPADAGRPDEGTVVPDAGADATPDAEPDANVTTPYCTDPLGCWEGMSMRGAPYARRLQVAVWTGSEMIIWAGVLDNVARADGGRYDPVTDSWRTMSVDGAPSPRYYFSTVWTGSEMIVWGGRTEDPLSSFNDGARYNPASDTWTPITATAVPTPRNSHTAVWTGSEMIVWGGVRPGDCCGLTDGGRYNPVSDTWIGFSGDGIVPVPSGYDPAIWTGSEMVWWVGYAGEGVIFNPENVTWSAMSSTDAPTLRSVDWPIWTGSEMLVWAGSGRSEVALGGGRYNRLSDIWSVMSNAGAPTTPRFGHTAVWTGSEMIAWGGGDGTVIFGDGGQYDPISNIWSTMSSVSAPTPRAEHTAVFASDCAPDNGDQPCMIIWGGWDGSSHLGNGGRYFLP